MNLNKFFSKKRIQNYVPAILHEPEDLLNVVSAWRGHHLILKDLITRFGIKTEKCLEFGVEFGFSTVAFSNYFHEVIGVDLFTGDIHTVHKGDHYEDTKKCLEIYKNIKLYQADYKDWIKQDDTFYDLIHVDIVHTYEDTYACGLWSAKHSQCTIFHDTESFPDVKKAVTDISKRVKKRFYNYDKHYGLGILI